MVISAIPHPSVRQIRLATRSICALQGLGNNRSCGIDIDPSGDGLSRIVSPRIRLRNLSCYPARALCWAASDVQRCAACIINRGEVRWKGGVP